MLQTYNLNINLASPVGDIRRFYIEFTYYQPIQTSQDFRTQRFSVYILHIDMILFRGSQVHLNMASQIPSVTFYSWARHPPLDVLVINRDTGFLSTLVRLALLYSSLHPLYCHANKKQISQYQSDTFFVVNAIKFAPLLIFLHIF